MDNRRFLMLVAAAVGLAMMVPGLGKADPTGYECSYYTCVKVNIGNFRRYCYTTPDRRPNCTMTASVSATAKRFVGVIDLRYYVRYIVEATGAAFPVGVPKLQKYEKLSYWGGNGPATVSGTVRAPSISGPVGGCLRYQATFTIYGGAGDVYPSVIGPLNMFDSVNAHRHSITLPRYCV